MLIVGATSVGFVVSQLDVSIVNVALASIAHDLHASLPSLQWTVDSYALAFAALMLSAGVLGDRFGARRLFVAGLALFALASLGCAFATDAPQLIAARALQGVGAAAMLPNSLALLNHVMRRRPAPARARRRAMDGGGRGVDRGGADRRRDADRGLWLARHFLGQPADLRAGIAATYAWVADKRQLGRARAVSICRASRSRRSR